MHHESQSVRKNPGACPARAAGGPHLHPGLHPVSRLHPAGRHPGDHCPHPGDHRLPASRAEEGRSARIPVRCDEFSAKLLHLPEHHLLHLHPSLLGGGLPRQRLEPCHLLCAADSGGRRAVLRLQALYAVAGGQKGRPDRLARHRRAARFADQHPAGHEPHLFLLRPAVCSRQGGGDRPLRRHPERHPHQRGAGGDCRRHSHRRNLQGAVPLYQKEPAGKADKGAYYLCYSPWT